MKKGPLLGVAKSLGSGRSPQKQSRYAGYSKVKAKNYAGQARAKAAAKLKGGY